ncbi:hypothetical protein [Geobacillus stearothermophilus]|uniref:hypothetical protein n=1 Tax=Geobacillus stearothermophilus TaxID=1422 RepID=UPI003D2113B8
MRIPLQIYDFIAVIFPAVILIFFIKYELSLDLFSKIQNDFEKNAFLFVFCYLVGHIIQLMARKIERWNIPVFINKKTQEIDEEKYICLQGRKLKVKFPKKIGQAILESLNEFYGFTIAKDDPKLFELAYGPVHDRMGKRDVLLSVANMMRSLILVTIFCSIFLILKIVWCWIVFHQFDRNSTILLIIFVGSFYLFRTGYYQNTLYSEEIPFTSFLAWYREQKINK